MSFREDEEPALADHVEAMKRAVDATGLPISLERVDETPGDFEIPAKIMAAIDCADGVLADFTLASRNVYFEAGYARGAKKPIVQTARISTALEFDVRNWRTLVYKNATELERKLPDEIVGLYERILSVKPPAETV